MKKNLTYWLATLLLLFISGISTWAEEKTEVLTIGGEDITASKTGISGDGGETEISQGDITVTSGKGYYNLKKSELTIYAGGTMVIALKEGSGHITKVELAVAGNYHFAKPEGWTSEYTNDVDLDTKFTSSETETFTTTATDATAFTISNASKGKTTVKKITVTYEVEGGDTPAGDVLENIAALNSYELDEDAEDGKDVLLTLTDAYVTYSGANGYVIIEDASGATALTIDGLSEILKAGQKLNGQLALNITSQMGLPVTDGNDNTLTSAEALNKTEDTLEPLELSEDNIMDYLENFSWRYVKLTGCTVSVEKGTYGDDIYVHIPELDDDFGLTDLFGVIDEENLPAEGDVIDITGFIFNYYGIMTIVQPLTITVVPKPVEIENIAALKAYDGEGGNVLLHLDNAQVTYAGTYETWRGEQGDYVVIEDASAGYAINDTGLGTKLKAGDILNGDLSLTLEAGWFGTDIIIEDLETALNDVTVTDGEATPKEITEDNLEEYLEDNDWRYVKFTDVKIAVTEEESWGETYNVYKATIPVLSDTFDMEDILVALSEDDYPADGDIVEVKGYIATLYGTTFLQPTAITVIPQPTVLENIDALKNYDGESGNALLQLTNAKVTYAGTYVDEYYGDESDYVVIEDESAAYIIGNTGLGTKLKKGDILNGKLPLTLEAGWLGTDIIIEDLETALKDVTITDGEATSKEITEDNLEEYLEDNDWRYVKFTDVKIAVTEEESWGSTYNVYKATIPVLDDTFDMEDMIGALSEEDYPADGDIVEIEGYIATLYGITFLQPTAITVKLLDKEALEELIEQAEDWLGTDTSEAGATLKAAINEAQQTLDEATSQAAIDKAVEDLQAAIDAYKKATGISLINSLEKAGDVYDLNGQRVATPKKGIYIINGKKVLVK